MTFTNTIKVDVGHPWKTAQVYVKQGDKDSRKIRAELMNGAASWTIPVGTVATFRAKKPDDTVVTQDATIGSPNIVEVVLDEQVGAVFGVVRGEIRLVNGGEILNTFLIAINVEAAAVTDEDIVSRDVLDEYQALVDQMLAVAGSPLVANAAADMTDKTRVYVYTGSEVGYVTGDWYYWDGAAWMAGGAYNSQGISDAFIEQTADYIRQSTIATESDRTPYLYRPTPNPSAILADEEIVGGTIAYNQLVENGNFSDGTTGWSKGNNTQIPSFTASDNVATFTFNAGSGAYTRNINRTIKEIPANHVVYINAELKQAGDKISMTVGLNNQGQTPNTNCVTATPTTANFEPFRGIIKTTQANDRIVIGTRSTTTGLSVSTDVQNVMVKDLTAEYGATIADYLYTLETGTPGAGVAKLREWGFLSKEYFAYNAGSLVSVNTEGKRVGALFSTTDADLMTGYGYEAGKYLKNDGTETSTSGYAITRYFRIDGGKTATIVHNTANNPSICFYDAGYGFISGTNYANTQTQTIVIPAGAVWARMSRVNVSGVTTLSYVRHTYPLTNTDLNGIFKLDSNNNLYADGDVYEADGTVTRKFGSVDLGSLEWTYVSAQTRFYARLNTAKLPTTNSVVANIISSAYPTAAYADITGGTGDKIIGGLLSGATPYIGIRDTSFTSEAALTTALSGKYLVYELGTETTETATPYTATQIVGKGGTERWIDNRSVPVPVGHETVYGIGIPDVPVNASNATLKATVSGGKTTLSWS